MGTLRTAGEAGNGTKRQVGVEVKGVDSRAL